jgi:hypothetical protein
VVAARAVQVHAGVVNREEDKLRRDDSHG